MTYTIPDAAPVTREHGVHVTLSHDVIRDVSGNWTARLYCGEFVSRGHPPVEAVWKVMNSFFSSKSARRFIFVTLCESK